MTITVDLVRKVDMVSFGVDEAEPTVPVAESRVHALRPTSSPKAYKPGLVPQTI